ncbi:Dynein regulatory complex subunit 6 [Bienertia sinuspersici]
MNNGEIQSLLITKCIDAATHSMNAVEKWRMQRRSLERLPSPLASALFHRLLIRRLLFPSLLQAFKYSVEEVDLSGENAVDAEWMAYLGAFFYLQSLKVAGCVRINNPALWPLAGMTSLKELDLSRCVKVTDDGIKHLLSISQLEKLYLSKTGVTAEGVKLLSALKKLSTLDLGGLPVSDMALRSISELINLEYLDVWGSEISDEGAKTFKNFSKLGLLNLTWTKVTKLSNLQSIECLNMSDCTIHSLVENESDQVSLRKLIVHGSSLPEAEKVFSSIEPSCFSFLNLSNTSLSYFGFLRRMDALAHLDLSFTAVQDDDAEAISCIGVSLRHLNLNHTKFSNAGLETLAGHVPNLEVLKLSNTSIDDFAIGYISTMPSLKELDLSKTNIKGFLSQISNEDDVLSLAALQDLKHLARLNLEMNRVTDEVVHVLLDFEELSHLSLSHTLVTDKCLEHLSQVKKLVNLLIQGTLLTNGALESFNPPITVEALDLRGCWLITMDSVTLFCKKHPGIKVRHDDLSEPSVDHSNTSTSVGTAQKGSKLSKLKQSDRKSSLSPYSFKNKVLGKLHIQYAFSSSVLLKFLA